MNKGCFFLPTVIRWNLEFDLEHFQMSTGVFQQHILDSVEHISGQFITTGYRRLVTPNGGLVREFPPKWP